jgi:hypothetical protein
LVRLVYFVCLVCLVFLHNYSGIQAEGVQAEGYSGGSGIQG